jgi:hypothetical protein
MACTHRMVDRTREGGTFTVDTLKSVVESGRPSFKTRMILTMIGLIEMFSLAQCKSERWRVSVGSANDKKEPTHA